MSLFKKFNSLILSQSEWPEFVKNYAPWWASHTLDWLKYGKKVQVVHFEDLKRNLYSELKGMVIFLSLEVLEDRLLCVEGQKDGNFKRSGLRKLEYDPYTPEMRATIDGLIKTVDTALRKRNLSGVPEEYMPRWYSSLFTCAFFVHNTLFFPAIPIYPPRIWNCLSSFCLIAFSFKNATVCIAQMNCWKTVCPFINNLHYIVSHGLVQQFALSLFTMDPSSLGHYKCVLTTNSVQSLWEMTVHTFYKSVCCHQDIRDSYLDKPMISVFH